jgi:hypothetical protein
MVATVCCKLSHGINLLVLLLVLIIVDTQVTELNLE